MASFFEGGKIPLIGVTAQDIARTAAPVVVSAAQNQAAQLVGQVFQGSGSSFLAGPGQAIVSGVSQNVLNIGLNAVLGSEITGISGIDLSSGQTILASVITPSITGAAADLVNTSISGALKSAGPFGPVLSQVASTAVNGLFGSLTGALGLGGGAGALLGGGAGEGASGPKGASQRFPGADASDPDADYGGSLYTLGPNGPDVVFTLQPANAEVQTQALDLQNVVPKSATTQAFNQFSSVTNNFGAAYSQNNLGKITSLLPGASDAIKNGKDFSKFFNPSAADKNPIDFASAYGSEQKPAWTFICAPESISWDISNQSNRVDIFGSNGPPVVAGTRGMRDMSISNALVEGFSRGVTVEGKIKALENLMNYGANSSDGFVSVPVYQFWANSKKYGAPMEGGKGFFIIKDVKVTEEMRDLKGDTTRAKVDISLMQVPEYQVNSGRDQASAVTTGARSGLASAVGKTGTTAAQGATTTRQAAQGVVKGTGGPGKPTNAAAAAGNGPKPATPVDPTKPQN